MSNIDVLLQKLTLEEKCALCSGVTNWKTTPIASQNVPSAMVADGPHGLRREMTTGDVANVMQKSMPATCFPPAVTVASAWDVELAKKMGQAIAEECKEQEVDVVLGPGVNIKRSPLCGRNFEYYSEDPYLAGELSASFVNGVQGEGIGTSLKHFAVNSQEYKRMTASSEVDERALREIYLPAFETTVKKAQPETIMCSYNPINGIYASDNQYLLTDILREEWGFEGIVVSDWGAVNDRVQGILAGLDLEMPTSNGVRDAEIKEAVESGKIAMEDLDKVVARILKFVYKCSELREKHKGFKADYDKNYELAAEIAAGGAVLLKNDGVLPLKKGEEIAVIGSLAKVMRYQGGGSSRINPYKLTSFVDYLHEKKMGFAYADGYDQESESVDKALIKEAVKAAEGKSVVLLFIGLTDVYESEAFDREHIALPEAHETLLNAIREVNENIVVVLSGGSPVKMPWIESVPAVLNLYLGGEAGGKACYQLLYGEKNPSGKLAETYPLSLKDNPASLYYGMGPQTVEYRESIFVGYRYFDAAKKQVLFPFGYGLSYTTFEYSDLKLSKESMTDREELVVSFVLKNTGDVDGAEVAQVYVKDTESTIFREEKALKGFAKVFLKAGEEKQVFITLDKRSFAYYNVLIKDWAVETGEFQILVGASSRDIRLTASVTVKGEEVRIPDYARTAPCYYEIGACSDIPDFMFEHLLDRPLADNVKPKKGEITMNTSFGDIGVTIPGKLLRWAIYTFSGIVLPKDSSKAMKKMVRYGAMDMPLRNAFAMTNGLISKKTVEGFVKRSNGHIFSGLGMILGGFSKKGKVKKEDVYKL